MRETTPGRRGSTARLGVVVAVAHAGWVSWLPTPALAHSFGRPYDLPVPFWLYGFGAAAALVLSFALVGVLVAVPGSTPATAAREIGNQRWVRALRRAHLVPLLRGLGVAVLSLCILTGLFGTGDAYRNFNMTFFWIAFGLGFAYLSAIVGDLYAAINPWRTLADWAGRLHRAFARGHLRYPPQLACWPAFLLYLAFLWIELFGGTRPFSLSVALLVYTGINLGAAWLFGAAAWFRHGELFAVFFGLLAKMSPLEYRPWEPVGSSKRLRWRTPLSGLLAERARSTSEVAFVLLMLSSTAFDGLRETLGWFKHVWHAAGVVSTWKGEIPAPYYLPRIPEDFRIAYETLWLLALPFAYLVVYGLCVWLSRRVTSSGRPVRELALDFAYALLPIALVYHFTHYFTLLITQGGMLVSLVSDPFGWGWNLFGTMGLLRPRIPDMGWVWHVQVALILLGHIASVYLAHVVALRVFGSRREALASQLPMLGLMVLLTVGGLWILALPLQGE